MLSSTIALVVLLSSSSLGVAAVTAADSASSFKASSAGGHNRNHINHRELLKEIPTYECGEVITTTTIDEITLIADYYVNILFSGDNAANIAFLDIAKSQLFSSLKYNIRVVKLCMSCSEAKDSGLLSEDMMVMGDGNDDDRYSFGKYCNEGEYGYDAIHSTLGFFPVDPTTDEIFSDKSLRTVMSGHQTIFDLAYTPTENWLQDWGSFLTSTDPTPDPTIVFLKTVDHIVQSVGAGSGAIALSPDYLGYGESYMTHNRTYFGEESYCQAFVLVSIG